MIVPNNFITLEDGDNTVVTGGCLLCDREWTAEIETIQFKRYSLGEEHTLPDCIVFLLETSICLKCREEAEGELNERRSGNPVSGSKTDV